MSKISASWSPSPAKCASDMSGSLGFRGSYRYIYDLAFVCSLELQGARGSDGTEQRSEPRSVHQCINMIQSAVVGRSVRHIVECDHQHQQSYSSDDV